MNLLHDLRNNRKGIGTVFGMVFFLLIVMVVFASFVIVLNQNTGLEQATIQAKQLDLDRYTELETVSISNPQIAVLNSVVYLTCTITNIGTLPTELVRLWIKDNTTNTVGNTIINPSITLQPGSRVQYFNFTHLANSGLFDQFSFWFISTRGNAISAFPNTNQLNGIAPAGTFPGVADINSTYQTNVNNPLQLSLNTTKPNQLIYVVVSFDDGNTLYTPTSTPSLTWTLRGTSIATDHNSGDSILKTFYAIDPSVGQITINIQSTADELSDYYCSAMACAISDVNTTSPFDGSAQTTIGRSAMPQDTINTHYSNDFIIGAIGIDDLNPSITPAAGFGQIMPVQSSYGASGEPNSMPRSVWSEWAIMGDPRNNLPVNCTFLSTDDWAIIVDAVKLVVVPPTAPMSLSPVIGPIGQPVTVSGQGFAANSQLIATFDGSQVPFSFTTDGTGKIPPNAIFNVPLGATSGTKNVTIIDSQFNYASANFTVTTTNITVNSQIGVVGTVVTVTGSNFIDNSTITINFGGNPIMTNPSPVNANATGSFSTSFVVSGTAGNNTVLVSDGVNSPYSNFTVIPSIFVTPSRGLNGTQVTLSGNGFAAQSNLIVTFDGIAVTTSGNPFTDITGSFSNLNFTAQSPNIGVKSVNVTDANGNFDNDTFKLIGLDHFNIAGFPSSIIAGQSFGSNNFVVTACDVDSYVLNGYVGQVYFSSSDNQALLPNTVSNKYTFTTTDGGVHTFAGSAFTLKTAGSEILTVTDGTKSNSTTVVVNPAAMDHFTFNAISSSQVAGAGFSITISAKDTFENTVTSFNTAGTLSDLSGTISPTASGNFASGVRTLTVTVTKTYTGNTISISGSSKSGISNAFTVNPGVLHHFTLAGVPASVTAGSGFAGSVTVTAYDSNNNVKTDYVGSVYFTSTDAQAVLPFTSGSKYTFTVGTGLDNGVHVFAGSGFVLKTAPSQTVTVRDDAASKSLTSSAVTVNFVALDHFTFNAISSPQVAGIGFSITITAQDVYGNTITSFNTAGTLSDLSGTISPTASGNFASGVRTLTVTVTKTYTGNTISISGSSKSGISNAFTVNPGVLHHFTLAGVPASVTAGQVFGSVTVTAYDSNNNVKTDYVGSVYFTSTDAQAVLPFTSGSKYTFTSGSGLDNGVHSFGSFALKTVGSRTITVTDGSTSLTSGAITVNFAPIDHFAVTGFTNPIVAGVAGSITVTAQDPYGNTITTYVGTVQITSSDGAATLPANHALASGVYTFTNGVTLKTTGVRSITATDTATGLITGSQTGIIVNPAVIASFTITGYPSSVAAGTSFGGVVVTAYDTYGNVKTDFTSTVYFTSTDGTAVLPYTSGSRYTFVSGDLGVHTFSGFTLKTVGSRTITVTDGTRSATSTGINVVPGVLDHFTLAGVPASVTAGSGFAGSVTVTAYDSNNNVKTDYVGSVYFTSTDAQAVLPFTSGSKYTFTVGTGLDNGVHVFAGSGFVLKTAPSQTVTVRDDAASKSLTSSAVTVNSGVLSKFAIGNIGYQIVGYAFSITVTAQDAYGNTVAGYSSSVPLSVSVGTISPTSTGTSGWSNSVWSGSVTLNTAGSGISITANDGSGHTGTSVTFTVIPAPTITTKSTVASTLSLQYTVAQPNSFVVIVVTSGDYSLNSVTWPTGFTQHEGLTMSNQYAGYIAVNTAQAAGSYTVSCQAQNANTGISIAVYVFAPGTYSFAHSNSVGTLSTASLTLASGANYYIFGGSVGYGTIGLTPTTIDVKDSSNWSAIGHQASQTATVTSGNSNIYVGIVGISISRTG